MEPGSAEYERWQRWAAAQKTLVDAARPDAGADDVTTRPDAQLVADTIVAAATTDAPRLRWPVGDDAQMVVAAKDAMSFEEFDAMMREVLDWRE
jgi:hypothetical protein